MIVEKLAQSRTFKRFPACKSRNFLLNTARHKQTDPEAEHRTTQSDRYRRVLSNTDNIMIDTRRKTETYLLILMPHSDKETKHSEMDREIDYQVFMWSIQADKERQTERVPDL